MDKLQIVSIFMKKVAIYLCNKGKSCNFAPKQKENEFIPTTYY